MNPNLDPRFLQNNGGPTPTIALLESSPAIDQVPTAQCVDQNKNPVTNDQRGFGRPAGPACDIGAFEYGATQLPGSSIGGIEPDAFQPGIVGLLRGAISNLENSLPSF